MIKKRRSIGLAIAILVLMVGGFNVYRARTVKVYQPCVNNLRIIQSSKEQWGLEYHKTPTDLPSWEDIRPSFTRQQVPKCPAGGTYTIGRLNETPRCSIGGQEHSLP
jgi:hypothetical protein